MERSQAISVAVGVGALGTALAYLAYSHINKTENNELIYYLVEKNENQINQEENIKLETKKDISCWGQFWKNEYNKQKNDNDENCDAEDDGDNKKND